MMETFCVNENYFKFFNILNSILLMFGSTAGRNVSNFTNFSRKIFRQILQQPRDRFRKENQIKGQCQVNKFFRFGFVFDSSSF